MLGNPVKWEGEEIFGKSERLTIKIPANIDILKSISMKQYVDIITQ